MTTRVQDEIKQRRPFRSLEEEALITLQRTADALGRGLSGALKEAGLTGTQYNVLRILRGAGEEGLACREIGERMVTRDPDITRLLDRMERAGLIQRARDRQDRRVIVTRITRRGLHLANSLDEPVQAALKRLLGHVAEPKLRALIELLDTAREGAG